MSLPSPFSELLEWVSPLCHGREDAVFCFRCTGVWAGLALALPILFLAHRKTNRWIALLLIAAFLQMPALGYGRVPLPETMKTLSGQLFALSILFFLSLNTTRRLFKRPSEKSVTSAFLFIAVAGILVLQVLIRIESDMVYRLLDLLCLLGLGSGAALIAWMAIAFISKRRPTVRMNVLTGMISIPYLTRLLFLGVP